MKTLDLLIIISFPVIILLNAIILRFIIRRAIKKHVKPILNKQGLTYLNWKWAGFFTSGDFNEKLGFTLVTIGGGSPDISLFVYVYYKDATSQKRLTIKIETIFFFIRKVKYSHQL